MADESGPAPTAPAPGETVGDVAGHDGNAAAAMAHARGVLRGVSHALGSSPSALLTALDAATSGDLDPVLRLIDVVRRPFEERPGFERYAVPAPEDFGRYTTYCGT